MTAETDLTSGMIEGCRIKYEATNNPMFVWGAIDLCRGSINGMPRPVPEWCFDYLREAARMMIALMTPPQIVKRHEDGGISTFAEKWSEEKSWEGVPKDVPAALGITRGGWNAFARTISSEADLQLALDHRTMRKDHEISSTEATARLMEKAGKRNKKSFEERLAHGRAMMKSKDAPQT